MALPVLPAGAFPTATAAPSGVDMRPVGGEPGVGSLSIPRSLEKTEPAQGIPFADMLKEAVANANAAQHAAEVKTQAFASGSLDDIHGTMIAIKQADIELKLVANVRNKLVEAFQDLWRMNI